MFGPGLLAVTGNFLAATRVLIIIPHSGPQHIKQRKALNRVFAPDNLRYMAPTMLEIALTV